MATPGQSAEELLITYGILERSVPIADLERFAATGELTPQLRIYSQQLQISSEQLAQAREALTTPAS
ncbi:MAG: alpha/beta hydrolase, partial [Nodosilinea sp.]